MPRLVVATGNAHKIGELRALLPGVTLVGLDAFPPTGAPDETAPDYEGNAIIKARAAWRHTGVVSLADDSGLEVAALDGAPGIHSARYALGSDADRRRALLAAVAAKGPGADRRARFVCAIALAGVPPVLGYRWQDDCLLVRGVCEGVLIDGERGEGGFGYDPLFLQPDLGRTFAELTAAEKHERSHRRRAVEALKPALFSFFGNFA